jgi:ribosomal protein S18 acetylase RimI-like enzyme
MSAEELTDADANDVVTLWRDAGLTRPWNDPVEDYRRALAGPSSTVLGVKEEGELVAAAMVGYDGHRGWVYYLAVRTTQHRRGIGTTLMRAAEEWLRVHGAVKVQLMVRRGNDTARSFYDRIGYEVSAVTVHARWLE